MKAVAAALGDEVFINPAYWGGNFADDWATMLHELIHNVTGIVDGARFTGDLSDALKNACRL